MDKNAKGLRGQALGDTTSSVKNITKPRKKSNCHSLADCIVALNLHDLEVDRLLDAIIIVEREEVRWDDPRIAIRRAVQHLQRLGLDTPALAAGVSL